MSAPMSVETRQRFVAAAERGLAWRREKIMIARLTFNWLSWFVSGRKPDWHSLFECERHGHHPLRATRPFGPHDFEDTFDTSGKVALSVGYRARPESGDSGPGSST